VRPRPERLERLPDQYFAGLLARVAAAARDGGEPVIDLGRGNPDTPPADAVIGRLVEAACDLDQHGYAPFSGLPQLKQAIAERYEHLYGVTLDPEREVAVVPGTKSAIAELVLCLAHEGDEVLVPDPGYPDYASGIALAGAHRMPLPLDPHADFAPAFDGLRPSSAAAVFLNYPSNPCAVVAPPGAFAAAVEFAERTGAILVHDFAYGDLVFDGRRPQSLLATPGARDVAVELFTMSKSYGMAGWRLGFVLGNAEVVARLEELQDHLRAGIFMPIQHAAITALRYAQEDVQARRALYEARRDRVLAALADTRIAPPRCEGSYYVWLELPHGVSAQSLLVEHRIALAPGEGFGANGRGWARLSVSVADDLLDLGVARLREALA
jgi:L-glutamine---4-(methylsulfanyl)-2-oxobutanoate aminotransferase